MKKNMGVVDRALRTVLAVAIILLYLTHQILGTAAIVLGVIAVLFLLTSGAGFCPVYALFGISTLKKGEHGGHEAHP